jgi:hypothetical protein
MSLWNVPVLPDWHLAESRAQRVPERKEEWMREAASTWLGWNILSEKKQRSSRRRRRLQFFSAARIEKFFFVFCFYVFFCFFGV